MQARHISTSISKAILSSLLVLFAPLAAFGHQSPDDGEQPAETPADSVRFFRGVAVSVDLVGPAQMVIGDYGQYEAAVRINLRDKYFPIVEVGLGKADAEEATTNVSYKTSAPYLRLGCDFNLMKNKHDVYRVYGGFRYGLTSFKYDLFSPGTTDPVWLDHADYGVEGASCSYHWLEGVVGIDAKLWRNLRLGWSVRYKRRLLHDDGPLDNSWYVPGYGKQGGTRLGGTFNIIFEL